MRLIHVSALVLVAACGGVSSSHAVPPVASSAPAPDAPVTAVASSEPPAVADAGPFDALPKSLPTSFARTTKPAPVKRSGKTWPFHAWDRAESVVMNWSPYGPESEMHAYDESGWTQRLAYRAPLDAEIARRSVALATKEGGELVTTKCPIPRHAVVLFDGDTAVASINVDLTCQNVLLWPQWPAKPNAMAPKLAMEFLPQWRGVFEGELHFPMWDPKNDR